MAAVRHAGPATIASGRVGRYLTPEVIRALARQTVEVGAAHRLVTSSCSLELDEVRQIRRDYEYLSSEASSAPSSPSPNSHPDVSSVAPLASRLVEERLRRKLAVDRGGGGDGLIGSAEYVCAEDCNSIKATKAAAGVDSTTSRRYTSNAIDERPSVKAIVHRSTPSNGSKTVTQLSACYEDGPDIDGLSSVSDVSARVDRLNGSSRAVSTERMAAKIRGSVSSDGSTPRQHPQETRARSVSSAGSLGTAQGSCAGGPCRERGSGRATTPRGCRAPAPERQSRALSGSSAGSHGTANRISDDRQSKERVSVRATTPRGSRASAVDRKAESEAQGFATPRTLRQARVSAATVQAAVDRLYQNAEERRTKLSAKALEIMKDEDRNRQPTINAKSRALAVGIESLTERSDAFQRAKLDNLQRMKQRTDEESCIDETFRPTITKKAKNMERSIDDMKRWDEERQKKRESVLLELVDRELAPCTFQPSLCPGTERIIQRSTAAPGGRGGGYPQNSVKKVGGHVNKRPPVGPGGHEALERAGGSELSFEDFMAGARSDGGQPAAAEVSHQPRSRMSRVIHAGPELKRGVFVLPNSKVGGEFAAVDFNSFIKDASCVATNARASSRAKAGRCSSDSKAERDKSEAVELRRPDLPLKGLAFATVATSVHTNPHFGSRDTDPFDDAAAPLLSSLRRLHLQQEPRPPPQQERLYA